MTSHLSAGSNYSGLRYPLRGNHSSREQAGSGKYGAHGHPASITQHSTVEQGMSGLTLKHEWRRGGRVNETFGSSTQLSVTLPGVGWIWLPSPVSAHSQGSPKMVHIEWCWGSPVPSWEPLSCWTLSAPFPSPGEVCWWGQEEQWEGQTSKLFNCGLTAE